MASLTIVKTIDEFTPTCGHDHSDITFNKCVECSDSCVKRQDREESLYDDLNICLSTKYLENSEFDTIAP